MGQIVDELVARRGKRTSFCLEKLKILDTVSRQRFGRETRCRLTWGVKPALLQASVQALAPGELLRTVIRWWLCALCQVGRREDDVRPGTGPAVPGTRDEKPRDVPPRVVPHSRPLLPREASPSAPRRLGCCGPSLFRLRGPSHAVRRGAWP